MFYRLINKSLQEWRESPVRKPLVLRGARQVGKTVAVRMFSESYDLFSELNLEIEEDAALFRKGLKPREILQAIRLKQRVPASETGEWLLFLDEIQACPEAVAQLRYFYEEVPDLHLIAAGSLLEVALQREHISFPVGRVEFRYLYPMCFEEFLGAVAGQEMVDLFRQVPSPIYAQEELFKLYHQYALIGGMPEAVAEYVRTRDVVAVNRVYENLFAAYIDDISKYARNESMARVLRFCLKAAPLVAGKRIRFAGFGESAHGSREVGEALRTLEQVMLVSLLYPTVSVSLPLIPNMRKSPRLQCIDTGLVHYVCGVQHALIGIDDLSADFRGGLLEQLTGQELMASRNDIRKFPLFWVREKTQSQAEVDFLELNGLQPVPVEVKSGAVGKLRSLNRFMEMSPSAKIAVRLYRGSFLQQEAGSGTKFCLLNLPYYHAAKIQDYLNFFHTNLPRNNHRY
ncbi:MAG: ATP-binding protein [Clostridiales bacterium]|nr:ATP-binding protein [Clostridiales bacterium]